MHPLAKEVRFALAVKILMIIGLLLYFRPYKFRPTVVEVAGQMLTAPGPVPTPPVISPGSAP